MWDPDVFTRDGFLKQRQNWNPKLAIAIATNLEIVLSDDHWQVINGVRAFYQRTGKSLSMRPLVRVVHTEINPSLASTIALSRLFGSQVSRHVSMISGLPKPSDCI